MNLPLRVSFVIFEMSFLRNKYKCTKYVVLAAVVVVVCEYMGVVIPLFETDYFTQFSYPLDVNMNDILEDLKTGRKPYVSQLDQYDYRFKIENANKCTKGDGNEMADVTILLLIKSAIEHREQRDAIRKSWGFERRFSDVVVKRVFVLGENLDKPLTQDDIDDESKRHRDIVQAAFYDTYFNNTVKIMMAFRWVVMNCYKAQYILLVDDDYYVSLKNLLKFFRNPLNLPKSDGRHLMIVEDRLFFLSNRGSNALESRKIFDGRLYAGYMIDSRPQRHKTSKWYVPLAEYPYSKYPPYITAGSVAMNYLTLLDMHYASLYTKHYRFDDVYMAILAKKLGIEPLHNENFHFWPVAYERNAFSSVISAHGFGEPQRLISMWEEQKAMGNA